jgi:hypothetical protein
MAKGFKTGGRRKGSKNKPKELVLDPTQRAATAGNARVHTKILPALNITPLDVMLENMHWAWNEANDIERRITGDQDATPETKSEALKAVMRLRDRAQSYAVQAAPYVHPKLQVVAPPPKQEEVAVVEVDPMREHLEEMAKFFGLSQQTGRLHDCGLQSSPVPACSFLKRFCLLAAFHVTQLLFA